MIERAKAMLVSWKIHGLRWNLTRNCFAGFPPFILVSTVRHNAILRIPQSNEQTQTHPPPAPLLLPIYAFLVLRGFACSGDFFQKRFNWSYKDYLCSSTLQLPLSGVIIPTGEVREGETSRVVCKLAFLSTYHWAGRRGSIRISRRATATSSRGFRNTPCNLYVRLVYVHASLID